MLCFVGALGQNIYGCGDNTIIDSAINVSTSTRIEQRDQPIIATINTSRKDLSEINLSNLYSHSGGNIWWDGGKCNLRNMKIIFNSKRSRNYDSSFVRYLNDGSSFKNINFQITGTYSLQYNDNGGTIYYQNCTFTGGSRQGNYSGTSVITTAPDNEIDTLIKNTSFQQKKEITFHPHKQRYKPSYTLIPLASSGYYDIT